jgi:hypothetical protein
MCSKTHDSMPKATVATQFVSVCVCGGGGGGVLIPWNHNLKLEKLLNWSLGVDLVLNKFLGFQNDLINPNDMPLYKNDPFVQVPAIFNKFFEDFLAERKIVSSLGICWKNDRTLYERIILIQRHTTRIYKIILKPPNIYLIQGHTPRTNLAIFPFKILEDVQRKWSNSCYMIDRKMFVENIIMIVSVEQKARAIFNLRFFFF